MSFHVPLARALGQARGRVEELLSGADLRQVD